MVHVIGLLQALEAVCMIKRLDALVNLRGELDQ